MENNQLPKIDKKSFIKKTFKKIIGLIAFVLVVVFIKYGYIPIKPIIIGIGIVSILILINAFLSFKYPNIFKSLDSKQVIDDLEKNKPKEMNKKQLIKTILIIIGVSLAFVWFIYLTLYIFFREPIPVKIILIVSGIFIVVLTLSMLLMYKYRNYITLAKIRKTFLVIGILLIIFNVGLILLEGGKSLYYMDIGLGIYFISLYKKD